MNTLALSIIDRSRELGLLRAIGLSRSQTRPMITSEAVIVAGLTGQRADVRTFGTGSPPRPRALSWHGRDPQGSVLDHQRRAQPDSPDTAQEQSRVAVMTRIVVGADASPSGAAALDWAMREAVSTGADLHAVRAWTYDAYAAEAYMYAAPVVDPSESTTAQLEADEQLKLATERVAGADTVDCTAYAVFGPTSKVLIEQANDAAMLVVGSRGHGALSRAVLGSVSASVLHHATGPVVIVPEPGLDDGAPPRVIVGVDHSPAALIALAAAAEHARRRGAPLVPVYVHEPIELPRGGEHPPDLAMLEDTERHQLEAAAMAAGGADVQAEVLVGNPVVQLLATARPQDLLVLGSRGRGGFAGLLLGSTSTQVAQHAPCPVLVVRA